MATQKHIIILTLLLFCIASVSAFTDYPMYGYDPGRSSTSHLPGAGQSTYYGIPTDSNFNAGWAAYPPLVGNIDADKYHEILIPYGNTMAALEFRNGALSIEYSDLAPGADIIPRNNNALLYDADGDGQKELYYCGTNSTHTAIVGYRFNASVPTELWKVAIGIPSPNDCHMQDSAGTPGNNHTYPPLAVDGYVYFFTANESVSSGRGFDVWKIDALNGSATGRNYFTNAACTGGIRAPGVNAGYAPRPWRSNQAGALNGPSPYAAPALCEQGVYDIIHIPVECAKTAPTTGRGILGVRADNLEPFTFGTSGYTEMTSSSGQPQFTSPICTGNGVLMIGNDVSQMSIYTVTETGATETDETDLSDENHVWVSDMFYGELNDGDVEDFAYDDVCFWGIRNTTFYADIFCAEDTAQFFENDVYARYLHPVTQASPAVHTTKAPTYLNQYDITDFNTDTIISLGLYDVLPSGGASGDEDFQGFGGSNEDFATAGLYGLNHGPCIGVDIDVDGYGDILCVSPDNISIWYSAGQNTPVDLKKYAVNIPEGTMCHGNLTFFIEYDSGNGYTDAESDRIQAIVDCESNSTESTSAYAAYGADFTRTCEYLTDGIHTARISLRDEGTETKDTEVFTVRTADVTGCNVPSAFPVRTIQGTISSTAQNATAQGVPDLSDTFLGAADDLGLISQNSKDLAFLICAIVLLIFMLRGSSPENRSNTLWIWAILTLAALTVFTVIGFVRPIYLIVIVIACIASFTIARIWRQP